MSSWMPTKLIPDEMPGTRKEYLCGGSHGKKAIFKAIAALSWVVSIILGAFLMTGFMNSDPTAVTYFFNGGGRDNGEAEEIISFWADVACVRATGQFCPDSEPYAISIPEQEVPTCDFFVMPTWHLGGCTQQDNEECVDILPPQDEQQKYKTIHKGMSEGTNKGELTIVALCRKYKTWKEAFALATTWQQGALSSLLFIGVFVLGKKTGDGGGQEDDE